MSKAVSWSAAFIVITLVFATIYATVQQSLRLNANDPQVQLAEDTANSLNKGASPSLLVSTANINADASLAPFIAVYNKKGTLVATNGSVAGGSPHIPIGVLQAAQAKSYNAVTWQPAANARLAAVSVASDNYYVLSARSLKEVEKHESKIFKVAAAGWFASAVILGFGYWLSTKR